MDNKLQKINTALNNEQIEIIKNTICKNATNEEMAYFLEVAKATGLNPFLKEIWFYKQKRYDYKNGIKKETDEYDIVIFTGRDGFLKKANEHPSFDGIESGIETDKNGNILYAWARVYRKDRKIPTEVKCYLSEYYRDNTMWKRMPRTMLIKCAESQALRKAFSITGLMSYEEMGYENPEQIIEEQNKEKKCTPLQAEKLFDLTNKLNKMEEITAILKENNVAKIIDLPEKIVVEKINEFESMLKKLSEKEPQKKEPPIEPIENKSKTKDIKYNFIPDFQKKIWVVEKIIEDKKEKEYIIKYVGDVLTCNCESRKKPCKHLIMLDELKSDKDKYNALLEKYKTKEIVNYADLRKEYELVAEEKGYAEAILEFYKAKYKKDNITALREIMEKYGIDSKKFYQKDKYYFDVILQDYFNKIKEEQK